jgi:hypothetical protein
MKADSFMRSFWRRLPIVGLVVGGVFAMTGCSALNHGHVANTRGSFAFGPAPTAYPSFKPRHETRYEFSGTAPSRVKPVHKDGRGNSGSGFEGRRNVTSPTLWDGEYRLDGEVAFHPSIGTGGFTLPEMMEVHYQDRDRVLTFYAESDDGESWYGMGMILHLVDEGASSLRRLSLITPNPSGGTGTFGFIPRAPVRWLSLRPGERSSSLTKDGKYELSVAMTGASYWTIDVEPTARDPYPWFTEGRFVIRASAAKPPWDALSIDLDTSNSRGSATAKFMLEKMV